jgi:hypothetical protein
VVKLVSWFGVEDSWISEAAGVSSDSKVWVMYQLDSAAVPSSVAMGWVADVKEAQVEDLNLKLMLLEDRFMTCTVYFLAKGTPAAREISSRLSRNNGTSYTGK